MNGGEGFLSVSEPRSGSQSRHQDLGRPEPSKKKWQLRNTAQSILIQKPLGQRWRVEGTIFTLLDGQPSTSTPPDNRAGHKSENFGRVIVPCSFFTDTSQVTVFFLTFLHVLTIFRHHFSNKSQKLLLYHKLSVVKLVSTPTRMSIEPLSTFLFAVSPPPLVMADNLTQTWQSTSTPPELIPPPPPPPPAR